MMNRITISGLSGTGKSSVGKKLAKKLNFNFTSIGDFTRNYLKTYHKGSINAFQEECKKNPDLDFEIDKKFSTSYDKKENIILDYRLGFHFIKNAFHVLLTASDDIAYQRIQSSYRENEDATLESIKARNGTMKTRFQNLYKVDFTDHSNYDLVIVTDQLHPDQVVDKIINHYLTYSDHKPKIPSVNFHLWEPCNMRCKFCFATFQDVKQSILPKGHLPKEKALQVVRQLAAYGFEKITFAGGEPLLCPWLPELTKEAKKLGLTTMIVSNGSRITEQFLIDNKKYLDWIAVSIDSLDETTNLKIGRAIVGKKTLSLEYYKNLTEQIKQHGYGLKINTVVNSYNFQEDFTDFILEANTKRWKVLQVLPIEDQNDLKVDEFLINQNQFQDFVSRHLAVNMMIPESNDAVKGSYVMVDPAGRFFDNTNGKHMYSKPILEIGVREAFTTMDYDHKKFIERGGIYDWG